MTHGQSVRAQGRRKSNFPGLSTVPSAATFDFVSGGTNYKITFTNLLAELGATGALVQSGDASGTPVLDKQGSVNNIRNLVGGAGVNLSLTPEDGIQINSDLLPGGASGVQVLADQSTSPLIRSIQGVGSVQVSAAGDVLQITTSDTPIATNTIVVNSQSDFPAPVADVITLAADSVYLVSSDIDIGVSRFVFGLNTSMVGSSAFATGITSSTSGDLFAGVEDARCIIGDMTISAPNARIFNFSYLTQASGAAVLTRLAIQSARRIGVFGNLRAVLISEVASPITESGIEFENDIKIVSVNTSQFLIAAGVMFDFGTSVVESVIMSDTIVEVTDSSVEIFDGLPSSGNISANGYATVSTMKVIGATTPSANILNTDVRWLFTDSFGLPNTTNSAEVYLTANAVVTAIAAPSIPVKLAGVTWQEAVASRYTTDNTGQITYVGENSTRALVNATVSAQKQGGGSDTYLFKVGKNGVPLVQSAAQITSSAGSEVSVSCFAIIDLVKNDTLDLFVENVGATNDMLVTYATVSVISDA